MQQIFMDQPSKNSNPFSPPSYPPSPKAPSSSPSQEPPVNLPTDSDGEGAYPQSGPVEISGDEREVAPVSPPFPPKPPQPEKEFSVTNEDIPERPKVSELYKRPWAAEPTKGKIAEETGISAPVFEEETPAKRKTILIFGIVILLFVGVVGGSAYILFNINRYGDAIPVIGQFLKERIGSSQPLPTPQPTSPSPSEPKPAVPSVTSTPATRDASRKAGLASIAILLEAYKKDHNNRYPESSGLDRIIGTNKVGVLYSSLVPRYTPTLSYDPNPNSFYGYHSDGTTYQLSAVLENPRDPECVLEGSLCIYRINERGEVMSRK